jgi:hypothetical protein
MKKKTLITTSLALACTVLASCGSSSSSESSVSDPTVSDNTVSMSSGETTAMMDSDTELETGIQGFTVEKIYLVDGDDKKITGSEVAMNSQFSIVYEGVKNYKLVNGKAFPGLSIQVVDNDQQPVISQGDLLASYVDGLSEADASVLRATVTVGNPMKPGKYICAIHVTDKNDATSAILSSWSFEVK